MNVLRIRQDAPTDRVYPIRLTLKRLQQPDREAEAKITFGLTDQEQEDLRWYLEDYLQVADVVEAVAVQQIEALMRARGEELYAKVLAYNGDTQALWFSIRDDLADLRVEITTGVAEAASIPWELMRDPAMDSPISLRVKSFVRVQSNPNISFVSLPSAPEARIRLLYVVCRPSGAADVELRAVANRLLQDLGLDRVRFDIKALRPPTFERLQIELTDAKEAGRPYHVVHFDGHGIYADLKGSSLADWVTDLSNLTLGSDASGKRGYLLFEHPSDQRIRAVDGQALGKLLHDNRVPVLVLNACQSAMHETTVATRTPEGVHDEVRAIGSFAQTVVDQGIPAVLGMRYSVYVVTAAQYIGQLYASLAKGRSFGQAATDGRKHLQLNPDRWIGLEPRPLQDWFVPVAYEAAPIELCSTTSAAAGGAQPELDPVHRNRALLRHVPEEGFIGRDETLLALDRAFDTNRVVLLHAYAGQGKSATAVEFSRWYALTGGLGDQPIVLLASFESHTDLDDLLNQIGQPFAPVLEPQGTDWGAVNDPDQRRDLVLQLLRRFPILWIWDNVEPVAGFPEGTESQWTAAEQSDLRDFLKEIKLDTASKVKILLTSRRDEQKWLGGIPHRVAMRRMTKADAAKLALKLGEDRHLTRAQIADWQPLLDYCAGNPLTLRVLVGQAVKMGLSGRARIADFVDAIRSGEQRIEDADATQGRDKSLGASLDYGFRHAFAADELPIIALLHLFERTVDVKALRLMGVDGEHALPELRGKTEEQLQKLLARAKDSGLLTHVTSSYFSIHPALPWFLSQLFASHYDGHGGRSTGRAALRAWVEAIRILGSFYHAQFNAAQSDVISILELEEANLLRARRLARRNAWLAQVISCMQGLRTLYQYQGRWAEWARLVEDIRLDCCTVHDDPAPDRQDEYSIIMEFRVGLARLHEHDLAKAAALQAKSLEVVRQQAAAVLALPVDAPLDDVQRHGLHRVSVGLFTLGQILREQESDACVDLYQQSLAIDLRIENRQSQAITEFDLGHAYLRIRAIRDLDAAERAYQRSLDLHDPNDALGRAQCIQQIGMVHHERLLDALREGGARVSHHVQAAERHYLHALRLYPGNALTALASIHAQLGTFYLQLGHLDNTREHLEKAAQYFAAAGNHLDAGRTRMNMALAYAAAAQREDLPSKRRATLLRAIAYAEAALRDFHRYQGRAANLEAETQGYLDRITSMLANLPS